MNFTHIFIIFVILPKLLNNERLNHVFKKNSVKIMIFRNLVLKNIKSRFWVKSRFLFKNLHFGKFMKLPNSNLEVVILQTQKSMNIMILPTLENF